MNGPQHYAAAEQALAAAENDSTDIVEFERQIQIASIHVQLAHVAAIAPIERSSAWNEREVELKCGQAWRNAVLQNGGAR